MSMALWNSGMVVECHGGAVEWGKKCKLHTKNSLKQKDTQKIQIKTKLVTLIKGRDNILQSIEINQGKIN